MARKRAVWTRAMRLKAAEHGRKGNRAGKRRGGLMAWHARTPEEQEAIRIRLRAQGGRQRNRSAKARAAQARRARAQGKARTTMTAAQAEFLADIGVVPGRGPAPRLTPPPAPVAARSEALGPPGGLPADWPVGRPHPSEYAGDVGAWARAVNAWDSAAYAAELARGA